MKIISKNEAVKYINSGDTLAIGGGGAGHNLPDLLMKSLAERFKGTKKPANLRIIHPCGLGDNKDRGLNHFALEGFIDTLVGGFWGNAPKIAQLAIDNKVKGYNFPQGVLGHLMRSTAGGEDGLLTKTGLHTFVDPRYEGGKVNSATQEDIVELIVHKNQEYLFYKIHPVNVAFIRGTSIDKEGNLTMEDEVGSFAMLSIAQATKVNRGIVIAQVKKINKTSYANPINVKVPGFLIDYVVEDPEQTMTFITDFDKSLIERDFPYEEKELSLQGIKKIISRRAAMELNSGDFVNLGYGNPDGIPIVAKQNGFLGKLVFMIEQGQSGGVIATGLNFGAMYNPSVIMDDPYQFDFFHGGGLDKCFLGFAQIDEQGNVNSSRFGKNFTGCGGFIDITQNTRTVNFCGAFAAKTKIEIENGKLNLIDPGKIKKFINEVEQVTFNGEYSQQKEQDVQYITERAVFKLSKKEGMILTEIAPGVNLENDILRLMDFTPKISPNLKTMDKKIFSDELITIK